VTPPTGSAARLTDRELGRLLTRAEIATDDWARLDEPRAPTLATGELGHVIGVTGPPGSGKSTLVDQLIGMARRDGLAVGVLAVDPSSPFTGGAVLGDRVRMSRHAEDDGVFIRSMGSRAATGGLARAARAAVRLLLASGKDVVVVETVGVGQAELDIMNVADTTLVVTVPALGDTVQMNKAGIMEIADAFAVNMADRPGAARTAKDIRQALMLGPTPEWLPPVLQTIAPEGIGVEEVWAALRAHHEHLRAGGLLLPARREHFKREVVDLVATRLREQVERWALASPEVDGLIDAALAQAQGPVAAARAVLRGAVPPVLDLAPAAATGGARTSS
jgi:LAO/AO transport system kinase